MASAPRMIYGTAWKKLRTRELVVQAVLGGFRGIDTATQPKHYHQPGVGEALRELAEKHAIPRSRLWVQSKFTSLDGQDLNRALPYDRHAPLEQQVEQSLATAFRELATDYLDSLVLHSPMRTYADTMTVWRRFEAAVDEGKVRQIGISNCYDSQTLQRLVDDARIKPAVLQNRFVRDSEYDAANLRICRDHGITYQSFWTLTGNPRLLSHPSLLAIASALSYTPAQALYRFLIDSAYPIAPLNGTTSAQHLREDLAVLTDERPLPAEHVRALSSHIWPDA